MATTFQTIFRFLTPSWLHTGEGEKVLGSLALTVDAFLERALQGLEARFPSRTGDSALALTGADRGILRGRTEPTDHYAARLIAWRYPRGHRTRGSAFALLDQVGNYWGDALVYALTIDIRGDVHTRTPDGTEGYFYGFAFNWDGAAATPNWGRFWLGLNIATGSGIAAWGNFGDPALWHGELNPDDTIGQTGVTPSDVRAMVRLFEGRAWKPAGTRAEWLLVNLDGASPSPDGTWGRWSKNSGGTQVASRYAGWRFWALSPTVNLQAGDSANFPTLSTLVDGSTYGGDPASFPLTTTLPDESIYGGDPATFPASVYLVDDGSPTL
jgi:hypothetical protein